MSELNSSAKLFDLITSDTTLSEFENIVASMLIAEDIELLGEGFLEKATNSLLFLSTFGPKTFSFDEYKSFFAFNWSEQDSYQLFKMNRRVGVIEESAQDRWSLSGDGQQVLWDIFRKSDEDFLII